MGWKITTADSIISGCWGPLRGCWYEFFCIMERCLVTLEVPDHWVFSIRGLETVPPCHVCACLLECTILKDGVALTLGSRASEIDARGDGG